jgi:CRP/FNR family transcriptional regulator, anaerobic regulatory protein
MPFATVAEIDPSRVNHARAARNHALAPVEVEDALTARRRALEKSTSDKPIARVAALLVSIARNNGYEGRDPHVMPDTLKSGFVADLLGIDIGSLAEMLVDLRRRGLIDSDASSALRLKDIAKLEALADGS